MELPLLLRPVRSVILRYGAMRLVLTSLKLYDKPIRGARLEALRWGRSAPAPLEPDPGRAGVGTENEALNAPGLQHFFGDPL